MKIKNELLWVMASTGVGASTHFLAYLLLAKIGEPSVFGQLAIINVILSIAFTLQDMGLSSYFIHKQSLTHKEQSTLFAINFCLGLLATFIVILIAYPVGSFYESEEITNGLLLVAVNFIFLGASTQYQAHFIKKLQNHILAKIEIAAKLAMFFLTVYFLFSLDLGLTGYLYAILISTIIKFLLFLIFSPKDWHPCWSFDTSIIRPALSFGVYQMGAQVINQFRTQFDQLIIGKWLGVEVLGIYALAKEFIMQPVKLLLPITAKVVLPIFAKNQNNSKKLARIFDNSTNAMVAFNTFVYVLLTVAIYILLPRYLDPSYEQSFEVFKILLLIGLLRPFGNLLGNFAQAKGKSKVDFKLHVVSAVIVVLSVLLAMPYETIIAFAIAMSISQLLLTIYSMSFCKKHLGDLNSLTYFINVAVLTSVYVIYILFSI